MFCLFTFEIGYACTALYIYIDRYLFALNGLFPFTLFLLFNLMDGML
jgi:hypothetical protein